MNLVVATEPIKHFKDSSIMTVYAPEVIDVFKPYTVKVNFNNLEMAKNYDLIGITGSCDIAREITTGKKESSPKLFDDNHFIYSGESELELSLTNLKRTGHLNMQGILENGKNKVHFYSCTIMLKNSSNLNDYSSKVSVDVFTGFYNYNLGIKNLPDGFELLNADVDSSEIIVSALYKNYKKRADNQDVRINMLLTDITRNGKILSYEELINPSMDKFNIKVGERTYESVTVGKNTAHIYYRCENRGGHKHYAGCSFNGFIIDDLKPILFDMTAYVIEDLDTYEQKIEMENNWKELFISLFSNYYFESKGSFEDIKMVDSDDDFCGDCKSGYVCGACGKCIKETKAVDSSQTSLSVDLEIKNDGKSILNSVESTLAFTVYPNLEINHNGKKIDYCDLKDPGLKLTIKGQVLGNSTYSGFTSGFVSDERELDMSCDTNLKESKPKCVFIVSPNSRKKFFEDASEIIDEYKFTASVKDLNVEKTAKLVMTPPKNFGLKLYSRNVQVQQGNNGVLEVTPFGGTTDKIIVKTSLMGPGKIGLESDKLNTDWILKAVSRKETLKIGYSAPAMGNFDIGKELESLSMTKLQTDAAIQIALDAATAYGGEYAGNIEALVEAGEYSSKIGHLTDTFKAVNGGRNILGADKAIKDMTGELGDAMQVNDGKSDATFTEHAADVGVIGISVAQTAVGVLTFIPNKIPGVNKLSAGVQTAFSAATNIWKANLQYISKAEKIDRAKELYYPVVLVVTAQDLSGWTKQEMHVFQIAYNQIK